MQDTHISLAHGNGGRYMRELIEEVFARHLSNPSLDVHADAVALALDAGEILFTTDGFTVQPLEFPGGDIGSLAVHGTTNDLAVAGAIPRYLSLNAFIEEGMEIAQLERIVASLASAARQIGVAVAAGDTKVLRRGEGGGLYLATTGIGVRTGHRSSDLIRTRRHPVSGPVGTGTAALLAASGCRARCDPMPPAYCRSCSRAGTGWCFMRDPTRGSRPSSNRATTGGGCAEPIFRW
jgi:hydrogenase expression/formation protein HypE